MSSIPKLRRRAGAGSEEEGGVDSSNNNNNNGDDKTNRQRIVVPSFFGGIMVGCLLMYLYVNNNNNKLGTTTNLRSLKQQQGGGDSDTSSSSGGGGWKDIHVFYGDKAGLGADPTKSTYAQVHQDEIILDLLGTTGYFIDLAANDALQWTNTLLLERPEYNWNGLCIEPNPTYWYGLSHRKCTVVGALMGGPTMEQVNVKFRGVFGGIVGKMDDGLANRKKEPKAKVEQRYTASLVDVLKRFNVPPTIDYLNLDIEGAEFLVMQHFPFDKYQIRVLTVERPNPDLKTLLETNGYIHLKDLAWWGETLWAHKSTGFSPEHPKIQKIITEGK